MRRFSIVLGLSLLSATGCTQLGATQPPVAGGSRLPQGRFADGRLAAAGFTTVYSFKGAPDGGVPAAPLNSFNGALYGTTSEGGASHAGTVFSLTPGGVETVLHSFTGDPDGATPVGGLFELQGRLYGTTRSGGAHGAGTVFSVAYSRSSLVASSTSNSNLSAVA